MTSFSPELMPFFFYGTLCDRELLSAVLRRPVAAEELGSATLPEWKSVWRTGHTYPILRPAPGAVTHGILFTVRTAAELDLLVAYEGPEYEIATTEVVAARPVTARIFRLRAGAQGTQPWDLAQWQARYKAIYLRQLAAAPQPTSLSRTDAEVVERRTMYQGFFRIDAYRFRHRRFDGGWSPELNREVFERGHAVAVMPYDPVRRTVVLIEQFRPGPFAAGDPHPWTLEVPAGIAEDGEAPTEVAVRELEEEAGLKPTGPLRSLGRCYVSPGGTSEWFDLFIAPVDASGAGGVFGLAEEAEDIRVMALPLDVALDWLEQGRIRTAPALIALLWLARRQGDFTPSAAD